MAEPREPGEERLSLSGHWDIAIGSTLIRAVRGAPAPHRCHKARVLPPTDEAAFSAEVSIKGKLEK